MYNFIHKKFKTNSRRKNINSHVCEPSIESMNFVKETTEISDNPDHEVEECESCFQFEKQAVILVNSPKKGHEINNLCEHLKGSKLKFQIIKPFKSVQEKSQISIWIISYSDKFEILKKRVEEFKKLGKVCVMALQKKLEIPECKKKMEHLESLKRSFRKKFHK